jgi:predicted transcriptional regulator
MLFLSIHPRFVDKILTGEKTIELRRQRPRSVAGDWIAVYATTPQRQLRGIVQVKEVRVGSVRDMWRHVQDHAAVTKEEYESYFCDTDHAIGIVLDNPISLRTPVSLEELREAWPSFQPPQGFRYLDDAQVQFVRSFSPRRKKAAA